MIDWILKLPSHRRFPVIRGVTVAIVAVCLPFALLLCNVSGHVRASNRSPGERPAFDPRQTAESSDSTLPTCGLVSLTQIRSRLHGTPLLAAVALWCLTTILVAWRWSLLLRTAGATLHWRPAILLLFRASVVGSLGLGQLGHEAYRTASVGSTTGYAKAVGVQVQERIVGLAALVLLAAIGWTSLAKPIRTDIWAILQLPQEVRSSYLLWTPFAFLAIALFGLFAHWRGFGSRMMAFFREAARASTLFARKPVAAAIAWCLSIGIHLCTVFSYFSLSEALRLNLTFETYLVAVPVVTLLLCLPISIAGIGVFEAAMLILLKHLAGVPANDVLALCVLSRVLSCFCQGLACWAFLIPCEVKADPVPEPV